MRALTVEPGVANSARIDHVPEPPLSDGSVLVHADARLFAGLLDGDEKGSLALDPKRKSYVHLVRGALTVNGQDLATGDALQVSETSRLALTAGKDAEVLVFDLAA